MSSTWIHFTWRALQLLEGREVDADPLTLCGLTSWGLPQGYRCVTESSLKHDIRFAIRMINSAPGPETPPWVLRLRPETPPWVLGPMCPECAEMIGTDPEERFLVCLDSMMERPPPSILPPAPASRVQGERVIDLLQAWLRREGPKARWEMEEFLWTRSHPGAEDFEEDLEFDFENQFRYLVMHRQSAGFWSTNIAALVRDGRLIRTEDGYLAGAS